MSSLDQSRTPFISNDQPHPWQRFVALGDSFTEGVGDPDPDSPSGLRGWADRVAEVLASQTVEFAYANLAIRGRLMGQIVAEQIEPAVLLNPDLISICAGGNDVIRPGSDPDQIAQQMEDAIVRLSQTGAAIILFTGIDTSFSPVLRAFRGKIAIYNENLRAIADRYDCIVADQWALKVIQNPRFFMDDRLHYNSLGHHEIARMVLRALNVPNELTALEPDEIPGRGWRAARAEDLLWAREHLVPWVLRRLRHQSSGDNVSPKRPTPTSITPSAGEPHQFLPDSSK